MNEERLPRCPVCDFKGKPKYDEKWNGIRGPGARVVERHWHCPNCGTVFAHTDGWLVKEGEQP